MMGELRMSSQLKVLGVVVAAVVAGLALSGCSTTQSRAPVEDRGTGSRLVAAPPPPAPIAVAVPESVKPLPGAENAGLPGYYSVKPGDTLIRIGLESGQHWKDLVKWNSLGNPNLIEVGQVLRVVAPGVDPNAASTRAITTARVESRPLDTKVISPAASSPAGAAGAVAVPPIAIAAPVAAPLPAPKEGDEDVNWAWPTSDAVVVPFDDVKVKGLVFGGKAGDAVVAAADGRVVYAGSGLRGYGNLIILKHNNTYLTAYAHNQTLLVKEDQTVRRNQKIAEMGSTDADGVRLHFEIRKQGKPIDPARLLPPR